MIINDLSAKTHENTGNKPAKPEIKNKPNMNPVDQKFNTHSFGVDYIYGSHGSRSPTGELKVFMFLTTMIHTLQSVPYPTTKTTGKCMYTGKVNSIDNQPLTYQNT